MVGFKDQAEKHFSALVTDAFRGEYGVFAERKWANHTGGPDKIWRSWTASWAVFTTGILPVTGHSRHVDILYEYVIGNYADVYWWIHLVSGP